MVDDGIKKKKWSCKMYLNPFTVVCARGELYRFTRIASDITGPGKGAMMQIPIVHSVLPVGDYTIFGHETRVIVERKDPKDLIQSLLSRREGFEERVEKMSQFKYAAIVVEGTLPAVIRKSNITSKKSIFRTYLAWSMRFQNIHWYFMEDFRDGEICTFRFLERYWKISMGICD
jgi:hypothetical protein